jgi:hypothetical protein
LFYVNKVFMKPSAYGRDSVITVSPTYT